MTMIGATGGGTVLGCSSHAKQAFGFDCETSGNSIQFKGVEWQMLCCEGKLCNGVDAQSNILTLRRVRAAACHASKGGGAFAVVSGGPASTVNSISIADSTILECWAPLGGGAVLALAMLSGVIGPVKLIDSRMSNCSATPRSGMPADNAFGYGGALALVALDGDVGHVHMSGLDISYGKASGAAGAVMVFSDGRIASLKMQGLRVANCNGSSAGGLVIKGPISGDVVLQDLTVLDCHATRTGFWDDDWADEAIGQASVYDVFPLTGGLHVGVSQADRFLLRDSVVARCSAWAANGWGGGITLTMDSARNVGARGSYILNGVLVESCGATVAGGVMSYLPFLQNTVYVENSAFRSNSGLYGGGLGVWFAWHPCVLGPNVSISRNVAMGAGAGACMRVSFA